LNRAFDSGVTHQHLYLSQIDPLVHQRIATAVPEHVRMHFEREAGQLACSADNAIHSTP
jgi:hypothetical protein